MNLTAIVLQRVKVTTHTFHSFKPVRLPNIEPILSIKKFQQCFLPTCQRSWLCVFMTHISDFWVGALRWLRWTAEFPVNAAVWGGAPNTLVLGVGMFTQAAVLSSHWAAIQYDCWGDSGKKRRGRWRRRLRREGEANYHNAAGSEFEMSEGDTKNSVITALSQFILIYVRLWSVCVGEIPTCQGAVNLPLSVSVLDVEGYVHLLLLVVFKLHTQTHGHVSITSEDISLTKKYVSGDQNHCPSYPNRNHSFN